MDGFLRLRYTTTSRQAADALYFSGTGPGTEHSMPADQNQGQVFSTSRRSMAGGAAEEGPKKAVELLIRDCLKTWKCMLEQAREPATRSDGAPGDEGRQWSAHAGLPQLPLIRHGVGVRSPSKIELEYPSHRMFGHIHRALNII